MKKGPQEIYILTDYDCGSAGDSFVNIARKSDKVTIIGRPTRCIIDVFNVVSVDYEDYTFWYGISRVNKEYFTYGEGYAPDIHIPWTRNHLFEDVDMMYIEDNLIKSTIR
ncbi:S41 family peptidase [Facklamia miroungae]|uniref:S41 family peptidase n=1 Tax=Facklamia miroungae TaxID=120956 RepID=UPI000B7FAFCE